MSKATTTNTKMIDKLTKEQEDLIPVYYQFGLDLGLNTKPANQTEALRCIKEVHEFLGGTGEPKYVLLKNPLEVQLEYNRLQKGLTDVKGNAEYNGEYWVFNWFISYYVFYKYILEVLFPEKVSKFPLLYKVLDWAKHLHYTLSVGDTYLVSEFPKNISLDKDGKLTNEYGESLAYDDYGLYSIGGELLDKKEWLEKCKHLHSDLGKLVFQKLDMDANNSADAFKDVSGINEALSNGLVALKK